MGALVACAFKFDVAGGGVNARVGAEGATVGATRAVVVVVVVVVVWPVSVTGVQPFMATHAGAKASKIRGFWDMTRSVTRFSRLLRFRSGRVSPQSFAKVSGSLELRAVLTRPKAPFSDLLVFHFPLNERCPSRALDHKLARTARLDFAPIAQYDASQRQFAAKNAQFDFDFTVARLL